MERKYVSIAAGWVKHNVKGEEFISCAASGEKSKVKLQAVLEDGSIVPVKNFSVFFNKDKKHERSPDVNVSFGLE